MEPIEAAIAEIESLEPGESFSYSKLATKYNVVRSTLSRRHKALTTTRAANAVTRRKMSLQQERELVRYIESLAKRAIFSTREMIQNFASQIAKEPVSKSWVTRFINQHRVDLISPWVTVMNKDRCKQSREGSSSRLSGSDWQKIERYIASAVGNQVTDEDKQLHRTIHSLQVQNELLAYEIKGLKEVLKPKERQEKKSKPLDLQQLQEQHGRARFWSPRALEEARAQQVVKDRFVEGKRVARAKRKKEKAKLPAKPPAKITKLSQKRKQPATKPPKQAVHRSVKRTKQVVGNLESREALGVELAAPPTQTRSGRVVKLPDRFE
jgi:hypothetical protein